MANTRTYIDFIEKWNLSDKLVDDLKLFEVLDMFYLEYTKEQIIAMIEDYYANADDIQNDIIATAIEGLRKMFFQEDEEK